MRWILVLLLVGTASLTARRAAACSPCEDSLDLVSTARRAGLVVVARRISEPHYRPDLWSSIATFEIQTILKGYPDQGTIEVTVLQMCGGYISTERGEWTLLFLEKSGPRYHAVNGGCAVQSLPMAGGRVLLSDISLPPDVLGAELGFHASIERRERALPFPFENLWVATVLGGCLGFVTGVVIYRTRIVLSRSRSS